MLIIAVVLMALQMATPVSIPNVLSGAQGAAGKFDDLAGLIANPPADRPLAGAVGRGGQRFCDFYGSVPGPARLLAGPFRPIIPLLCKPYWDGAGYDPPTVTGPGFTGGQCDAQYRAFVTNNGSEDSGSNIFTGPIAEARLTGIGNPIYQLFRPDGSFIGNFGVTFGAIVNPSIRFEIQGGVPDDCGDPPEVVEPGPNPPPNPGPWPPGQEPGFDPITGQPFFFVPDVPNPVIGDDPIPVGDPLAPESPAPAPPQPSGDGIPGEGDAVGSEAGESTGGEEGSDVDFGEPPPNKIWVGCLVESQVSPAIGNIPGTGPENTVYPVTIANISLRFSTGRGESKQVRSRWAEVIRPATSLVVEGAFIQSRIGVTSKVFPISATVCKEPSCGDV